MNPVLEALDAIDPAAALARVREDMLEDVTPGCILAMEYAFEHVADGFDECDPRLPEHARAFAAFVDRKAEERVVESGDDILDNLVVLPDGRLRVWRELVVPADWFAKGILERPLGVCWAWDGKSAEAHNGSGRDRDGWVLAVVEAAVDPAGVDWLETVGLNAAARYTVGEESEVRLRDDASVEVLGLTVARADGYGHARSPVDAAHLAGLSLPAGPAAPAIQRDPDEEHGAALSETGRWGRAGAGCVVVAASTGRVLLPLRSEGVMEPGTWGTWGGAVDRGNTPEQQALAELDQEAGFRDVREMVPALRFEEGDFRYHNFVAVVDDEFEPTLNWESDDARWFEPGDWPEPLHPGLAALLADADSLAAIVAAGNRGPRP